MVMSSFIVNIIFQAADDARVREFPGERASLHALGFSFHMVSDVSQGF